MENRKDEGPKSPSRRRFLVKGAAVLIGAAGWAAGAALLGREIVDKKNKWESPIGEPIDGEEAFYETDKAESLLRIEPKMGDTPYWTLEKGITVKCRKVFGVEYPTGNPKLVVEKDGRKLGVWYEFLDPVKVKDKDGNLIEVKGYMSGNFLRKLTEEEIKELNQ